MNVELLIFVFSLQLVWTREFRHISIDEYEVGSSGDGQTLSNASFQVLNTSSFEIESRRIDILLTIASTTVTTLAPTTSAPTSCATSSINGKQTLLSGEVVVCEDGWTVFQRRLNGSVDFQQNWKKYKMGFGDLNGEFWLGLDKIHRLTSSGKCRLKVDLWSFEDEYAYAKYKFFKVDSAYHKYRLHVRGYRGTAGDSFSYHNNQKFSTFDRDNDRIFGLHCATQYGRGSGGWWFNYCLDSALNAPWNRSEGHLQNIIWVTWKGVRESLKQTQMMSRCD